jgi:uncharacterized tellurite resistance protein B-like protein
MSGKLERTGREDSAHPGARNRHCKGPPRYGDGWTCDEVNANGAQRFRRVTMNTTTTNDDKGLMGQARKEIEDLKATAAAFGPARLRDGTWFEEFVRAMLKSYAEEIIAKGGVKFFRRKYPGLTQDAIVDKLCDLAVKYAALSGGLSGATSSAAFAATIGTGGVGLGATMPVAVSAITSDILFTTRLQVRLVYDISTVYGYPIELSDPEELMRAFSMAYGVSYAAGGGGAVVKYLTPEVARAQLRALTLGHTAAIQAAFRAISPRIGSKITQKAILKAAVPLVGIGMSSVWNYAATYRIAAIAKSEVRLGALARDTARDIVLTSALSARDANLVYPALVAILLADGRLEPCEKEVYKYILMTLEIPPGVLETVENRVEADLATIEAELRAVPSPAIRHGIAELCRLGAAVRGEIAPEQNAVLARLLAALGEPYDHIALQTLTARYKRKDTLMEQASQAVQQGASQAFQTISSAGMSAGAMAAALLKKKPAEDEKDTLMEQAYQAVQHGTSQAFQTISSAAMSVSAVAADLLKKKPAASAAAPTDGLADYAEAVQRLTLLKESGLLNEDEIQAERQELLRAAGAASGSLDEPSAGLVPAKADMPVGAPTEPSIDFELSGLKLLINLAKMDGKIDDSERELLDQLISMAEIGEAEKLDLWHRLATPGTQHVDLSPYTGRFDKGISLIVRLVELANINGVLHPAERLYIKKIAEQLQLPKDDVEAMLTIA